MSSSPAKWFFILLALVAVGCAPDSVQESFAPRKTAPPAPPPVIQAKLNPDLTQYSIRYFTPVTREAEPLVSPLLADDGTEFRLVEYGPEGEVPESSHRPAVQLSFSQSVIPLAKVGTLGAADGFAQISPPLAGLWRWQGTRLLTFEPSEDLKDQIEYSVSVKKGLKSLSGKVLTGQSSFRFHGMPLQMTSLAVGPNAAEDGLDDVPPAWAQTLTLTFNTEVDAGVAGRGLEVRVGGTRLAHTAKPGSNPRQLVLQVQGTPAADADVEVVLKSGSQARAGALIVETETSLGFHTLRPFRALSNTLDDSWTVRFSHPIDPANVAKLVHIVPDVGLGPSNIVVTGRTLQLVGLAVNADSDYTVTVDPGLKDVWGRTLGKRLRLDMQVDQPRRYAYFPDLGAHMLEKGSPARMVWEGENLTEGTQLVQKSAEPYAEPVGAGSPIDFTAFGANVRHLQPVDFSNLLNPSGTGWVELAWDLKSRADSNKSDRTWMSLQVTDLGLTLRFGADKVVAWVTSIATGNPVAGAKVTLQSWQEDQKRQDNRMTAYTDDKGLAVFSLGRGDYVQKFSVQHQDWREETLRVLVESKDDSIVFVPNWSHNPWEQGVNVGNGPLDAQVVVPRTFLFTDRQLYRPGETVTWRSLDKNLDFGVYKTYEGPWRVVLTGDDDAAAPVAQVQGRTSATGGSWGKLDLPADLKPGDYALQYQRPDAKNGWKTSTSETVSVNNFRKLLFTVKASHPDVPFVLGDTLKVALSAEYLSGGVLSQAAVQNWWTKEPSRFDAAGSAYESYAFGPSSFDERTTLSESEAALTGQGTYESRQKTVAEGVAGLPYLYRYNATVTDQASHQSASASSSMLVHPADFYIGIKLGGQNLDPDGGWLAFLAQNQDAKLELALVRPDGQPYSSTGNPAQTALTAQFVLHEWKEAQQQATGGDLETRWVETRTTVASLPVSMSEPTASVTWKPAKAGEYSVEVSAVDKAGRAVVTSKDFYVSGAEWVNWAVGNPSSLGLTPEHQIYQPGQTAKLIVRSPLAKGKYLVTVEREGIFDQRIVELTSASSTIEVPVKEAYLPVVYVSVASFTKRTGKLTHDYDTPDLDKPHALYGVAAIKVDSELRRIDLEMTNDQAVYKPGAPAAVTIRATNRGKPVADAEITFLAVDRGVVDLIDYHVADPLAFFYDRDFFPLQVRGADSRSLLIDPVTYQLKDQPGGAGDDGKLQERKDFRPTAVFEPALKTDGDGKVTVKFPLPDSLTTYRSTAFAVKGDLYGLAESELAVRNPINVKANLPRGLRERDTTFSGVLVTNLDKAPREVSVSVSSDLLTVDGQTTRTVTVPIGQTQEVAFQLAAPKAGAGHVSFTVRSDTVNEIVTEPLAVERPVVWEAVATLGKVTGGAGGNAFAEEALVVPAAAPDSKALLTLTLDATRIASLGNSFRYLFDYPYGCLEQRSSKLLPIVLFGKYLPGFAADWGLTGLDPQTVLAGELKVFAANQLPNGGFPLWPGGTQENSYVTLRVAHILVLAKQAGLPLGTGVDLPRLLARVEALTSTTKDDYLLAYGLYLQAQGGQNVSGRLADAFRRWNGAGATPVTAAALALGGLAYEALGNDAQASKVLDRLKTFLKPYARSVEIDVKRMKKPTDDPDQFYGSTLETYALVLMLYHQVSPDSDMIQRLLNALSERQSNGLWGSTADNYWALQAFGQVLAAEEKQTPAFDAKVTLGSGKTAESLLAHRFEGLKADKQSLTKELVGDASQNVAVPLRFEKNGAGTLFYTAEMRYSLPPELTRPISRGLDLFTEVLDWDGHALTSNTLVPGKLYRMKATLSTSKTRTQVGLRLAVPSGAEILDARFLPTARDADNGDVQTLLFDNQVQFIFPVIPAGSRSVEFLFRAVNQGVYPTPPAQAEALYQPEVFGRDIGRLFVIQAP